MCIRNYKNQQLTGQNKSLNIAHNSSTSTIFSEAGSKDCVNNDMWNESSKCCRAAKTHYSQYRKLLFY